MTLGYDARCNVLAGVCHQHHKQLKQLEVNTIADVEDAKEVIAAGAAHIASEFTVVALAGLGRTDYASKPILALPSCKAAGYEYQVCDWTSIPPCLCVAV
jgi:hypothetical protein